MCSDDCSGIIKPHGMWTPTSLVNAGRQPHCADAFKCHFICCGTTVMQVTRYRRQLKIIPAKFPENRLWGQLDPDHFWGNAYLFLDESPWSLSEVQVRKAVDSIVWNNESFEGVMYLKNWTTLDVYGKTYRLIFWKVVTVRCTVPAAARSKE